MSAVSPPRTPREIHIARGLLPLQASVWAIVALVAAIDLVTQVSFLGSAWQWVRLLISLALLGGCLFSAMVLRRGRVLGLRAAVGLLAASAVGNLWIVLSVFTSQNQEAVTATVVVVVMLPLAVVSVGAILGLLSARARTFSGQRG